MKNALGNEIKQIDSTRFANLVSHARITKRRSAMIFLSCYSAEIALSTLGWAVDLLDVRQKAEVNAAWNRYVATH